MYVYTFIGAGLAGAGMLVVPATMQALFKWPACDPIGYGVIDSVYLACGLVSLLGIRDPVKFVPLLFIQLSAQSSLFRAPSFPGLSPDAFPITGRCRRSFF